MNLDNQSQSCKLTIARAWQKTGCHQVIEGMPLTASVPSLGTHALAEGAFEDLEYVNEHWSKAAVFHYSDGIDVEEKDEADDVPSSSVWDSTSASGESSATSDSESV